MTHRINLPLVSLFFTVLLLTTGVCNAEDSKTTDDPIVATVNQKEIRLSELRHFSSKMSQQVSQERALQEMINVELLVQAATKEQMPTEPELKMELERTRNGLIGSYYLQQKLKTVQITEAQLREAYEEQYVTNSEVEYNANHILVDTQDEAQQIIQKLKNGTDFEELAKQLSTGPSGKNGGALGWFKAQDMVPPFAKAVQNLEPGSLTQQPVKTRFGYHVVKLNETRKIDPPTFETVKQQLATAIASQYIEDLLSQLKQQATIELKPATH